MTLPSDDLNPRNSAEGRRVLHREVFFKGKIIIQQGDTGVRAYYIERGRVEILVHDASGKHQLRVAEMGPGDIFGEMALITGEPRSATARALEDCTLTVISRDEIDGKIRRIDDPAIRALINVMADRLRHATLGQLSQYMTLAELQSRVSTMIEEAGEGLTPESRAAFQQEITPLLNDLQTIMDKYQGKS